MTSSAGLAPTPRDADDEGSAGARAAGAPIGAVLARIEARLERLEQRLAPLGELSENLPAAMATATDVLDEKLARLGDAEARLNALANVAERLTRPQTLKSLDSLVDIAENAPGLVATFTDVIDETMSEAAAEGLELDKVFDNSKRLAFGLLKLTVSPQLRAMLDSGMLDPRALRSLGDVARTLVEVGERPPEKVGMFGALRALRDDDVQRALGFVLQIAASFGRTLDPQTDPSHRLTAGK